MNFLDDTQNALEQAFPGSPPRMVSSGGGVLEENPFNAWMAVSVDGLTIRIVRDHGLIHVDVQCSEEGGDSRWVTLELLSVAAGIKTVDDYAKAYKASLDAFDTKGEMPEAASVIAKPLHLVARKHDSLVEAAQDAKAVHRAEVAIEQEVRRYFEPAQ